MITFSRLGEFGRLGNQLFQYAILLAVGSKNNYEIKIPSFENKRWHGQKCLLGNFNISAKTLTSNDIIKQTYSENEVDYFNYNSSIFNVADNTDFFGYFQNYQYYKDYEDIIIKELTPNKENLTIGNERILKLKEKYPNHQIISLHIRRGDSDLGMYGTSNLDHNSDWYNYLINAKKIFYGIKSKFLIFTGGNNVTDSPISDYEWCRRNLNTEEYIYSECENTTINDFTLMYLSDAHILSPISSLSWWVGFLNKKNNKTIVSPEKYYFLKGKMVDGFYPDNFILI